MHNNFVLTFSKKNANGMPKQKVKKKSATIVFFMRMIYVKHSLSKKIMSHSKRKTSNIIKFLNLYTFIKITNPH